MNRTEHILTVLGEEGGEVAKETSKALRFGLMDQVTMNPNGPRGTEGPTNADKIAAELIDMLGVYQMAVNDGLVVDIGLDALPEDVRALMKKKAAKVESFMLYAQRVGALENTKLADAPRSE
jgi:hypothetical protein